MAISIILTMVRGVVVEGGGAMLKEPRENTAEHEGCI